MEIITPWHNCWTIHVNRFTAVFIGWRSEGLVYFQVVKGLLPPDVTICNYLPLSVAVMWELGLSGEVHDVNMSTALGKYRLLTSQLNSLKFTAGKTLLTVTYYCW